MTASLMPPGLFFRYSSTAFFVVLQLGVAARDLVPEDGLADLRIPVLGDQREGVPVERQRPPYALFFLVHGSLPPEGVGRCQHRAEVVGELPQRVVALRLNHLKGRLAHQRVDPLSLLIGIRAAHRKADQRIHRHMEEFGEIHDKSEIRLRAAAFPLGNRAQRDPEPLRKLLLSESQAPPIVADMPCQLIFHVSPPAAAVLTLTLFAETALVMTAPSFSGPSGPPRLFRNHHTRSLPSIEHPIRIVCQVSFLRFVEFG